MAEIDLTQISNEIRQKPTITKKLDYWNGIRKQYSETELLKSLNGTPTKYAPLFIPEPIFKECFDDALKEPEFTYWLLEYFAQFRFEILKEQINLEKKEKSPFAKIHIEAELKEIKDFQDKVDSLILKKEIDCDKYYTHSAYANEIEYVRIKEGYYKEKTLYNPNAMGDRTVEVYARYILLKEYLDKLIKEPTTLNGGRTKQVISETFENMDEKGWQYAFVSEKDYNLFTDLLTNFFEYKTYSLPKNTIQLKRTCKTKVAKALGELHKELSNKNKLINDDEYFKLVKILNPFENETKQDLYKALTR